MSDVDDKLLHIAENDPPETGCQCRMCRELFHMREAYRKGYREGQLAMQRQIINDIGDILGNHIVILIRALEVED